MMNKPFTIAIVGAPASGKSTTAAMLYAELMQLGLPARLVMEQASAWLGSGKKIETVEDQMNVSHHQMHHELAAMAQKFNPIICDSAVWLGEIYMNEILKKFPDFDRAVALPNLTSVNHYYEVMNKYKHAYDFTVLCPLFSEKNGVNQFRFHDNEQSKKLQETIALNMVVDKIHHEVLSKDLDARQAEIKFLAQRIFNIIQFQEPKQVGNA